LYGILAKATDLTELTPMYRGVFLVGNSRCETNVKLAQRDVEGCGSPKRVMILLDGPFVISLTKPKVDNAKGL
jgi:hypothetical protein